MQYRSSNTTVDSGCQIVYIVTTRWSHMSDIIHHSIEWFAGVFFSSVVFTQVRYADKRIVNILKVKAYVEKNNRQLEY